MPIFIKDFLINFAIDKIIAYIKSSKTHKDDKILKVVQEGAKYLAPKTNNNLSDKSSQEIQNSSMIDLN